MTALSTLRRLLTVADYAALDEDELQRFELQEGNLVTSPSPTTSHMMVSAELYTQLRGQLPAQLLALYELDTDLQLAPPIEPGTVRRPDLMVVPRDEIDRSRRERSLIRARAIVLAVEIVSAGSRRTDSIIKRAEYADAGIPHYWMIGADDPVTLTECVLADGGYRAAEPVTGAFEATVPFPVQIDLTTLG